ncbi:hypothetical protein CEXT_148921, partial [Caerostris extrusa]
REVYGAPAVLARKVRRQGGQGDVPVSEGFCRLSRHLHTARSKCQRSLNCSPGQCVSMRGEEVCLCPPGYYSERGFCKEANSSCSADCKPGKCDAHLGVEKCLCPAGFTAKDNKCIEISLHVPGKLTTVLLMVIVAAASVILTTLFGVGLCYYFSQRN